MTTFVKAVPVWPEGLEREMNTSCRLFGKFNAQQGDFVLRVTGATIYRAFLNGQFFAYGPARCAHDYFRVDEWPVPPQLLCAENELCVEAVGYNVNCYAYLDQPSFLQAELLCGGMPVLFTGENGQMTGGIDATHVQKAERYSFQRAFTEAYVIPPNSADATMPCTWTVQAPKKLVPRRVPLPVFSIVSPKEVAGSGSASIAAVPAPPYKNRSTAQIGPSIKGYTTDVLDAWLTNEIGQYEFRGTAGRQALPNAPQLAAGEYQIYDFGQNKTGFLRLTASCDVDTTLYLLFDERLHESGDVDHIRMSSVNVVKYVLPRGEHSLLTMEPYVMQVAKVFCAKGAVRFTAPCLVEYKANLPVLPKPQLADAALDNVYDAAIETFMQNSVDIFMDCPSRERAGWLCDSFFSARAEKQLTGANAVEENFLENYLLPEKFPTLPDGVLPMCYPAEHVNGNFIPNWCMWLVLELEDYLARGGKRTLADAFQPKVYALRNYLKGFENEVGLLEDLAGWIFLDWSRANDADVVCGVNYPSNMVYARMLQAMAVLYDDAECTAQAAKLQQTIREMSFNGTCFADNSIRQDGALVRTNNTTEACQNYAFFCGTATAEKYPLLWADFLKAFDPAKGLHHTYNLPKANAFIALYVRLAALADAGCIKALEADVRGFFLPQASQTGTLWEMLPGEGYFTASLNHGFASYAANLLALLAQKTAQ